MENHNPQNPVDPEQETPAQRLRRILSSTQHNDQINHDETVGRPSGQPVPQESSQETVSESAPVQPVAPMQPDQAEPAEKPAPGDTQRIPVAQMEETRPSAWDEFLDKTAEFLNNTVDRLFNWISGMRLPWRRDGNRNKGNSGRKPPRSTGTGKSGCLVRGLVIMAFSLVIIAILGLSFILVQYFTIAASLPSVDDLRQYASQFETTRIYDRNGSLIYEIIDPNAGRRTYTELDEISPFLIAATIATEDKDFYTNPGFDPLGIVRAFWQNYTSGEVVSGASTITQQLARTLLLSPEERSQVTTQRKAREIVLAAEITRRYSKDEILELYLNEIYYGNLAYGIEAAAETYFNTTADQLNLAQASFLAGLPQRRRCTTCTPTRRG